MDQHQSKFTLFASICFLLFTFNSYSQNKLDERHLKVALRMIGHQVLLYSGDSTSLVLPIEKENNQYRVQFDSEFEFNPEELVEIINQVVEDANISQGYIMEVNECGTNDVVYSYEMGNGEDVDIIACKTRSQPRACYSLLFTFSNQNDLNNDEVSYQIEEANDSESNRLYVIITVLTLLFIMIILFLRRRKGSRRIDPNLIQLGIYKFDKRNTELILEEQRIELTSKEAGLLMLLYNAANETVERETILNKVWGDEGDYIGRTLDVFISKLRKKLEADSNVKIVNIRGVGYKLVLNV